MPKRLTKSFFNRSVLEVAPDLIGATLLVNVPRYQWEPGISTAQDQDISLAATAM